VTLILDLGACSRPGVETPSVPVFPQPTNLSLGQGTFSLTPDTWLSADEASRGTARQLADYLAPATGYRLEINPVARGAASHAISLAQDPSLSRLGDEGYVLEVRGDGVRLSAAAQAGLFWGVQTIRQLLPALIFSGRRVEGVQWTMPCLRIEDQPRFRWRGLMLDSGHDFQALSFVYRFIDLLAMHKFNTFHWHLTDLGTWSLEIKGRPELSDPRTRAPGVKGGAYTQEQVRDVVKFALERHITIVPEIDMPGHSVPALLAYPELDCPVPYEDKPGKRSRPSHYCLGNEKTYAFLEEVLAQVVDLFPSQYIHVGGDEMQEGRWKICPVCQARKKAEGLQTEQELKGYFIRRIGRFLKSRDRRLIGWAEILEGGPRISDVAVMSWHDVRAGRNAAIAGYDVVMTPKNRTYFDHPQTSDGESDPESNGRPFTTLQDVLNFEPIPEGLTSEQEARILGGEGEMWTDRHPRESSIDRLVYPRAIALIEILWTHPKVRDYPAFTRRLPADLRRLDLLGVHYRPLGEGLH